MFKKKKDEAHDTPVPPTAASKSQPFGEDSSPKQTKPNVPPQTQRISPTAPLVVPEKIWKPIMPTLPSKEKMLRKETQFELLKKRAHLTHVEIPAMNRHWYNNTLRARDLILQNFIAESDKCNLQTFFPLVRKYIKRLVGEFTAATVEQPDAFCKRANYDAAIYNDGEKIFALQDIPAINCEQFPIDKVLFVPLNRDWHEVLLCTSTFYCKQCKNEVGDKSKKATLPEVFSECAHFSPWTQFYSFLNDDSEYVCIECGKRGPYHTAEKWCACPDQITLGRKSERQIRFPVDEAQLNIEDTCEVAYKRFFQVHTMVKNCIHRNDPRSPGLKIGKWIDFKFFKDRAIAQQFATSIHTLIHNSRSLFKKYPAGATWLLHRCMLFLKLAVIGANHAEDNAVRNILQTFLTTLNEEQDGNKNYQITMSLNNFFRDLQSSDFLLAGCEYYRYGDNTDLSFGGDSRVIAGDSLAANFPFFAQLIHEVNSRAQTRVEENSDKEKIRIAYPLIFNMNFDPQTISACNLDDCAILQGIFYFIRDYNEADPEISGYYKDKTLVANHAKDLYTFARVYWDKVRDAVISQLHAVKMHEQSEQANNLRALNRLFFKDRAELLTKLMSNFSYMISKGNKNEMLNLFFYRLINEVFESCTYEHVRVSVETLPFDRIFFIPLSDKRLYMGLGQAFFQHNHCYRTNIFSLASGYRTNSYQTVASCPFCGESLPTSFMKMKSETEENDHYLEKTTRPLPLPHNRLQEMWEQYKQEMGNADNHLFYLERDHLLSVFQHPEYLQAFIKLVKVVYNCREELAELNSVCLGIRFKNPENPTSAELERHRLTYSHLSKITYRIFFARKIVKIVGYDSMENLFQQETVDADAEAMEALQYLDNMTLDQLKSLIFTRNAHGIRQIAFGYCEFGVNDKMPPAENNTAGVVDDNSFPFFAQLSSHAQQQLLNTLRKNHDEEYRTFDFANYQGRFINIFIDTRNMERGESASRAPVEFNFSGVFTLIRDYQETLPVQESLEVTREDVENFLRRIFINAKQNFKGMATNYELQRIRDKIQRSNLYWQRTGVANIAEFFDKHFENYRRDLTLEKSMEIFVAQMVDNRISFQKRGRIKNYDYEYYPFDRVLYVPFDRLENIRYFRTSFVCQGIELSSEEDICPQCKKARRFHPKFLQEPLCGTSKSFSEINQFVENFIKRDEKIQEKLYHFIRHQRGSRDYQLRSSLLWYFLSHSPALFKIMESYEEEKYGEENSALKSFMLNQGNFFQDAEDTSLKNESGFFQFGFDEETLPEQVSKFYFPLYLALLNSFQQQHLHEGFCTIYQFSTEIEKGYPFVRPIKGLVILATDEREIKKSETDLYYETNSLQLLFARFLQQYGEYHKRMFALTKGESGGLQEFTLTVLHRLKNWIMLPRDFLRDLDNPNFNPREEKQVERRLKAINLINATNELFIALSTLAKTDISKITHYPIPMTELARIYYNSLIKQLGLEAFKDKNEAAIKLNPSNLDRLRSNFRLVLAESEKILGSLEEQKQLAQKQSNSLLAESSHAFHKIADSLHSLENAELVQEETINAHKKFHQAQYLMDDKKPAYVSANTVDFGALYDVFQEITNSLEEIGEQIRPHQDIYLEEYDNRKMRIGCEIIEKTMQKRFGSIICEMLKKRFAQEFKQKNCSQLRELEVSIAPAVFVNHVVANEKAFDCAVITPFVHEIMRILVENAMHATEEFVEKKVEELIRTRKLDTLEAISNGINWQQDIQVDMYLKVFCLFRDNHREVCFIISNTAKPIDPKIKQQLNQQPPAPMKSTIHKKKGGSGFGFYFVRKLLTEYCGEQSDAQIDYDHANHQAMVKVTLPYHLVEGAKNYAVSDIIEELQEAYQDKELRCNVFFTPVHRINLKQFDNIKFQCFAEEKDILNLFTRMIQLLEKNFRTIPEINKALTAKIENDSFKKAMQENQQWLKANNDKYRQFLKLWKASELANYSLIAIFENKRLQSRLFEIIGNKLKMIANKARVVNEWEEMVNKVADLDYMYTEEFRETYLAELKEFDLEKLIRSIPAQNSQNYRLPKFRDQFGLHDAFISLPAYRRFSERYTIIRWQLELEKDALSGKRTLFITFKDQQKPIEHVFDSKGGLILLEFFKQYEENFIGEEMIHGWKKRLERECNGTIKIGTYNEQDVRGNFIQLILTEA